jgi:nitronate monooxygenase
MLRTRFCDLFGIEHPIISAPMGDRWAGAELAAAVSEAGGLGLIGGQDSEGGPAQAAWLREQVRDVRARTDRPFGVGFIVPFLTAYDQAALPQLALEEGASALAFSFGDPTPYIAAAHAAGAKVLVQIQTVAQARHAVAAGADVIAAQGIDGGGHIGEIGTLSLVPAVVDAAGDVPVVAAGGIADGRGLAAALLLGAEGAWLGTRFVASEEWAGGDWYKEAVVRAGTDDTVRTLAYDVVWDVPFPSGIANRVLCNAFTNKWHGRDAEVATQRTAFEAQLTEARIAENPDVAAVLAGSAVGLIDAVESAGAIVWRVVAEAEHLLRERPSQLLHVGDDHQHS